MRAKIKKKSSKENVELQKKNIHTAHGSLLRVTHILINVKHCGLPDSSHYETKERSKFEAEGKLFYNFLFVGIFNFPFCFIP